MKNTLFASLLGLLLLVPGLTQAANGLYASPPPPGSAFVRVLNLGAAPVEVQLSGKSKPQKVNNSQLGGYLYITPGNQTLTVDKAILDLSLAAESATTVIYDGKVLKPIADTYSMDPNKVMVAFYNLTDKPLALKTLDGKHAIVDSVAQNQMGTRLVNEIKIGFAAYNGEQDVATFAEQFLKKGGGYSYVAYAQGGQVRTLSLSNSFDSLK
ncbi:MAG: alginate O-acetyltransferase AlgF [Pseudomonadota bacterium]